MKFNELYGKVWGWYKGLPTWKKVVFFVVLVFVALLGVVYLVYQILDKPQPTTPKKVDDAHKNVVDSVVNRNRENQRKLEAELMMKKSMAMRLARSRVKNAEEQKEVRERLRSASSFEEVDAILKGLKR